MSGYQGKLRTDRGTDGRLDRQGSFYKSLHLRESNKVNHNVEPLFAREGFTMFQNFFICDNTIFLNIHKIFPNTFNICFVVLWNFLN